MESGLLIGGRYRLREPLGRGGMSVVWRADDEVLGRDVAVKVLVQRLAAEPDLLRRIRDEARAAASLRHPHVVEVYDYGEWNRVPYVVMEALDGRPMADLLTVGALPWKLAVLIGAQVAGALSAAHARGVVHRDVKPANVMVTASGVKLVDFGISAAVGEWESPSDHVLGTPAYLAPERIGGGPARPATDVYALGLLLYLALSGRRPWTASTTTQMLKAHVYADPAPLPSVSGLPRSIVRLVHHCLAKSPADRPTAAEVADRLGELAGLAPNHLLRSAAVSRAAVVPAVATEQVTVESSALAWMSGVSATPARKSAARWKGAAAWKDTVTWKATGAGKSTAAWSGAAAAARAWRDGRPAALPAAVRAWWDRSAGTDQRPRIIVASLTAAVLATGGLAWAVSDPEGRVPAAGAAGTPSGQPGVAQLGAGQPSAGQTAPGPAVRAGSTGNGPAPTNATADPAAKDRKPPEKAVTARSTENGSSPANTAADRVAEDRKAADKAAKKREAERKAAEKRDKKSAGSDDD